MTSTMGYLTRGSGIVATVLMIAALFNGFLFSGRETGKRLRPAWWLDLHNGLGGYALIFTAVHVVTAYAADIGVGVKEVFVPGAASVETAAFAWGVLALYALAATVLTSWPKKLGPRKVWHAIHLLSVPATALAAVHAFQLGSDADRFVFRGLAVVGVAVAVYGLVLRLTGLANSRRAGTS